MVAVAAAGVLWASACGSTVSSSGGIASEGFSTPEEGLSASGTFGGTRMPAGLTGADAGLGTALKPGRATATDVAATSPDSGPRDFRSLAAGQGITDTEIFLGFPWANKDTSMGLASSVSGGESNQVNYDNQRAMGEAVIAYLNEHGGIAGRRVTPVWFEVNVPAGATKDGRAREAQRACATFTEDHHVFAFTSTVTFTEDNILQCAVRTRTVLIDTINHGGIWVDQQRFAELVPYYYRPTGMLTERAERSVINGLERQGFFTADARVGLMIYDEPSVRRGVERALKPRLRELGVKVVAEAVYPDIVNSPWANYVLGFQSAGVTHVIFSSSPGADLFESLFFMRAAEAQRYRPRYGGAHGAAMGHADAPVEQKRNAQGINWLPWWIDRGDEAYAPVSANDDICQKIMRDKGFSLVGGSYGPYEYCDFLFFLKQALERADALSPEGLAASVSTLGDGWSSAGLAFNGATRFAGTRTDGLAMVRDVAWSEKTGHHEYTSEPYPAAR